MRPLTVLGVTGSIGRQTLQVAESLAWPVAAVGARHPSAELLEIARTYPQAKIAISGGGDRERQEFAAAIGMRRCAFGDEAMAALAAEPNRIVMNAVVGVAGLPLTLAAAAAGNRIALANKESMVAAGPLVNAAVAAGEGELIPVDSEHSAIMQCLVGEAKPAKVVLTASGGPFRGMDRRTLAEVTPAQALRHPNWQMGERITVDSATLANKALEVLEAISLFELSLEQVEVVVHPESIIHSLVVFPDGSIKAQLGSPDMRLPIAYALTYPERAESVIEALDFPGVTLNFERPDEAAFPALGLGYEAGRRGGNTPAVFNAADEVAVDAFLTGRLDFLGIADVIEVAMDAVPNRPLTGLADVLEADAAAREVADAHIERSHR